MEKIDLIVIGGGPAGYRGAEMAGKAGLKVLLIEKENIGGVCLNEGCVPSKAFLHSAKIKDAVNGGGDSGVVLDGSVRIDQAQVVKYKDKVVKRLIVGVKASLKGSGVTIVSGQAYILGKEEGAFIVQVGEEKYVGEKILIASGSSPLIPGIEGLKEGYQKGYVLTNREALALLEIPEKLVVIGGGVIGLELGSYYSMAGSKVTVVEMLPNIGGPIDEEISGILRKSLEKKGVLIETSAKVIKVGEKEVFFEKDGEVASVEFDKVLVSIGRKANISEIGLETVGIKAERGIQTNLKMETEVKNVYAAGDVTGAYMLAHVAYREADVAVNNILGKEDYMSYSAIPSVIYTTPEVGAVGETEKSATEKGIDVKCIKTSLMFSGRYIAESEERSGILKLIYKKETDTLIGASVIGPYSSEYIGMISSFIGLEIPVEQLKKQIYPHPTVSEVFRDALFEI